VLVLLGAVGDEVVEVSIAVAGILWSTLGLAVHTVVVKPLEPVDDQRQLIICKCLHLLLCNRHQRR
jgi:hypothetical protein